jgi:hypothetical protein
LVKADGAYRFLVRADEARVALRQPKPKPAVISKERSPMSIHRGHKPGRESPPAGITADDAVGLNTWIVEIAAEARGEPRDVGNGDWLRWRP